MGFAIYAVYNTWGAVKYGQPLFLLWSAAYLLCSTGLWFQKPWSRFAVYIVGTLVILDSLLFVMSALATVPYVLLADAVVALVLRLFLVAVFVWSMVVTHRFFRVAKMKT